MRGEAKRPCAELSLQDTKSASENRARQRSAPWSWGPCSAWCAESREMQPGWARGGRMEQWCAKWREGQEEQGGQGKLGWLQGEAGRAPRQWRPQGPGWGCPLHIEVTGDLSLWRQLKSRWTFPDSPGPHPVWALVQVALHSLEQRNTSPLGAGLLPPNPQTEGPLTPGTVELRVTSCSVPRTWMPPT